MALQTTELDTGSGQQNDADRPAALRGIMTAEELTRPQKAAAVMLSLPKEKAAKLMAHLTESEVEQLTLEIATLRRIPPNELQRVIEEFHTEAVAHQFLVSGGVDHAREILRAIHGSQADDIVDRLLASVRTTPFNFLQMHEPAEVIQHLRDENPQTLAVILAHVPTRFAAQVLAGFPADRQGQIARRIATLGRTTPDVVMKVERALQRRFGDVRRRSNGSRGGVKELANLLNQSDRSTERAILGALDLSDPTLAEEVRALMFVFEDIVILDDRQMQEVLRHVEIKRLAYALKGTPEEVSGHVTNNLSERGKIALAEEVDLLGAVPRKDVESAQTEVVQVIRRLEEDGTLVISRGGEEGGGDVIA
jgi:flagellar motor switch protein FliG